MHAYTQCVFPKATLRLNDRIVSVRLGIANEPNPLVKLINENKRHEEVNIKLQFIRVFPFHVQTDY